MTNREAIEILKNEMPCNKKSLTYSDDVLILALDMAIKALKQAPKKGHWTHPKVVTMPYEYADSCSCCKEWGKILTFKANFCPNCGADMRGDKGE